jgi:hypothetical protein
MGRQCASDSIICITRPYPEYIILTHTLKNKGLKEQNSFQVFYASSRPNYGRAFSADGLDYLLMDLLIKYKMEN